MELMDFPAVIKMVLLLLLFVSYSDGAFVKSRTWHEEFVPHEKANHRKVLYPRFKVCRAPREKPEKINLKSVSSTSKSASVSWTQLLSIYSADSGSEIYNWDFYKKYPDENKSTRWDQVFFVARFMLLLTLIFTLFVVLVPTVGRCTFKFYALVWWVIFHPEVRRTCRRIVITVMNSLITITQEKIARAGARLLNKTGDKTTQQKRKFRLAFSLREYNEEEVPEELQASEDDESDAGEVSSEGFENLQTKTKPGSKHAKNLVHAMHTTEVELKKVEEMYFEENQHAPEHRKTFLMRIKTRMSNTKAKREKAKANDKNKGKGK